MGINPSRCHCSAKDRCRSYRSAHHPESGVAPVQFVGRGAQDRRRQCGLEPCGVRRGGRGSGGCVRPPRASGASKMLPVLHTTAGIFRPARASLTSRAWPLVRTSTAMSPAGSGARRAVVNRRISPATTCATSGSAAPLGSGLPSSRRRSASTCQTTRPGGAPVASAGSARAAKLDIREQERGRRRREQRVDRPDQGRGGAVVVFERVAGFGRAGGPEVGEDVRPAEPVDGLLGVADPEQAACPTGRRPSRRWRTGARRCPGTRPRARPGSAAAARRRVPSPAARSACGAGATAGRRRIAGCARACGARARCGRRQRNFAFTCAQVARELGLERPGGRAQLRAGNRRAGAAGRFSLCSSGRGSCPCKAGRFPSTSGTSDTARLEQRLDRRPRVHGACPRGSCARPGSQLP